MKYILFTMYMVVGNLFCVSQQANAQQKITFGIKGGASLYNYSSSFTANYDLRLSYSKLTTKYRLGWHFGMFANIPVNKHIQFQPELIYIQKGGNETHHEDGFTYNPDQTGRTIVSVIQNEQILNYIDLPLLVRFNIPLEIDFNPYLIAGPSISLLLNATRKFGGESENESDYMSSFNFGFNIGSGVNFGQFGIDLRYEFGLLNIFDYAVEEVDSLDFELDGTTSGLMLTVGYTF